MDATRHRYPRLALAVFGTPWAITPEKLEAIAEVMAARVDGWKFDATEIAAGLEGANARRPVQRASGLTAVLPMYGVISKRANMLTSMSGGTSTDLFGEWLDAAVADPQIKSIVLDIDSPGGSTDGIPELAAKIREAAATKKVTAIANTDAASAAYWLGSQANEFVVTPSGSAGSIGVFAMHVDQSEADAAAGLKYTIISAGKHKAEGHPHAPLAAETSDFVGANVRAMYSMFVEDVAKGRGVSADEVRNGFGQGRMLLAADAVRAGLVDRIATLDEVLQRHGGANNAIAPTDKRAEAERLERMAEIALSHRESARLAGSTTRS